VIFAYWTLKVRIKTAWIYPIIILYTFLVGLLDEMIQYILPNRVYDFKDVFINWASSFLATGLVFGGTWKRFAKESDTLKFRKWCWVIILLILVSFGAFLFIRSTENRL
jgi:glycopeptide antibiotics resistance protein